ncbi:MAG: DUF2834 domain-containing protein [Dolichospermum sp.]
MMRKITFGLLWLGFISYAFFFAPPEQPDTFELIKNLSTGNWQGINPLIICLFNIMGVWPFIYSGLVFFDGRVQKILAWPFAIGSFALGAFALLPYLALREPNQKFIGEKNSFLKILDSRILGILLMLVATVLFTFSLQGDWSNFVEQWQNNRFIHVMSLDFIMLSLLFPTLLGDDMMRRGWQNNQLFWLFAMPLFGALIYLCVRPPIEIENKKGVENTIFN